jgi:hypothetical protein
MGLFMVLLAVITLPFASVEQFVFAGITFPIAWVESTITKDGKDPCPSSYDCSFSYSALVAGVPGSSDLSDEEFDGGDKVSFEKNSDPHLLDYSGRILQEHFDFFGIRSYFNVSSYFDVLPHLFLAEGVVLDYMYHFDDMGGYPMLYVRNRG